MTWVDRKEMFAVLAEDRKHDPLSMIWHQNISRRVQSSGMLYQRYWFTLCGIYYEFIICFHLID